MLLFFYIPRFPMVLHKRRVADASVDDLSTPADPKSRSRWAGFAIVKVTGNVEYDLACTMAVFMVVMCAIAENITPTAYGKFGDGAGLLPNLSFGVSPRIGWWLMEAPCTFVFAYQFYVRGGPQSHMLVPRVLAGIFLCHYAYRGWLFPFLIRTHKSSTNFDLPTAVMAWVVTSIHVSLRPPCHSLTPAAPSPPAAPSLPATYPPGPPQRRHMGTQTHCLTTAWGSGLSERPLVR